MVVTAEEVIDLVERDGYKKTAETVDVVTTGTFGPMCSSGMFVNFGHSKPPIKMTKVTLNDVPAYAGLAAVDAYIGATELSLKRGMEYGGAHVIEDFIAGKDILLQAESYGTDCYPRKEITTKVNKDNVNQIFLLTRETVIKTMRRLPTLQIKPSIRTWNLLPNYGNVTYSTSGELSPLLNTRIPNHRYRNEAL